MICMIWDEMGWTNMIWHYMISCEKKWCDMIRYKNWFDWIWYDIKRLYDFMRF